MRLCQKILRGYVSEPGKMMDEQSQLNELGLGSERESCIICDSEVGVKKNYPKSKKLPESLNFETIHLCTNCGFGRAFPVASQKELDDHYNQGNYWEEDVSSKYTRAHQRVQAYYRINKAFEFIDLGQLKDSITILDVGAGQGDIGYWFGKKTEKKRGTYHLIEPDKELAAQVKAKYPDLSAEILSTEGLEANSYDVIFLNHVLEHVERPVEFVETFLKALKPGGLIYIEVPNRDDLFKNDVFPHTLFFSYDSMKKIANRLSLEICQLSEFGSTAVVSQKGQPDLISKVKSKLFYMSVNQNIWWLIKFFNSSLFKYKDTKGKLWLSFVGKKNHY